MSMDDDDDDDDNEISTMLLHPMVNTELVTLVL
jgi:hypothetical protein